MKPLYSRATSVYKQAPVAILVSNQGCCFYIYRYLAGNFHYSVALQLEVCFWVEKDLLRVTEVLERDTSLSTDRVYFFVTS